LLGFGSNK